MQIVNTADKNEDIVLVVKRKKFPWWILLFLLPLVLLWPVAREISVKFVSQDSSIPVPQADASISYGKVTTFGGRVAEAFSGKADSEGAVSITAKEPLWYKLFASGAQDSVKVTAHKDNCSGAKNFGYREFGSGVTKTVEILCPKPEPVVEEPKKEPEPVVEPPKKQDPPKEKPKKEEPPKKQDPPKKEEPKKEEPPEEYNRELKGKRGELRVNLQWYCRTDLDLWVEDPCGNVVFANNNRVSCGGGRGTLDVDANSTYEHDKFYGTTTTPQENMYWDKASRGKYKIMVDCYFWRETTKSPIKYTITIEDRGKFTYKTGTISEKQRNVVCEYEIDYD